MELCKRDLAEKLQDLFEQAYESNQPFATREENVAEVEKMLEDKELIHILLDNLSTIINEYFLWNEGSMPSSARADELYCELEKMIMED